MNGEPAGMRRLPTQKDLTSEHRSRVQKLRPSRNRASLWLAVGALPIALLVESRSGLDAELVFGVLWLGAAFL